MTQLTWAYEVWNFVTCFASCDVAKLWEKKAERVAIQYNSIHDIMWQKISVPLHQGLRKQYGKWEYIYVYITRSNTSDQMLEKKSKIHNNMSYVASEHQSLFSTPD